MKKVIVAVLVVAILAAIGGGLFLKGKKPEGGGENFIPADALIYISQRGISNDWEKLKDSNFWKEITSSEGWQEIESQLRELQGKLEAKVGLALDEGSIRELLGKEVALALLPGEREDLKPRRLLLTRVGMKTKVQERLVKMQDKLSGEGKLPSEIYKEVEITNLKTSLPGVELSYAFLGDWLVLEMGKNGSALKETIDIHGGENQRSLANNESFQEIRSKLPKDRAGLFYLNVEEALAVYPERIVEEISKGKPPLKELSRRMNASLEMFKTIGGATWFDKGLKAEFCLLLNREKADENLREMYSWKPRKSESIKYIPQGTIIYAGSSFDDISVYWKYLRETLKEQNPLAAERMFEGIERLEIKWGLSLEDDILSWIGNEFAYALSEVNLEGLFPLPGYFLMLKVRDEKKARETLGKVENILEGIGLEKKLPVPLKFGEEEYEGEEIKVLRVPFLEPGYAFVNDFLIISTNTSTIKKSIDTERGKGVSLLEDANFNRVNSVFRERSNGLGYLNIEKTLTLVRGLTNRSLSAQERQLNKIRSKKAALETREFETPEERERELEALQKRLEMMEGRVNNFRNSLEEKIYPLLESLKVFKSLGVNVLTDKEGAEQRFYLAVEE